MNLALLFSFIFEGIISNFVCVSKPLFTLTALVIAYPYYNSSKEYFKMCVFFGILYDIVYTDTLFINGILFLGVGLITKKLNYYLVNNLFNSSIILIINIIFYRLCIYFILLLSKNSFLNLFSSIYLSVLINLIFLYILYFIITNIRKRIKN